MHKPDYAPLSLVNDDGTNSPLRHQLTISRLIVELGVLYYHKKTIPFVPLPETPLAEGPGYPVPDVLLYDREAEQTRVIIEICNSRSFATDLRKIIRLIEEDDYGILEGFVYNYKTNEWLRYRKGDRGASTASSISEVLGVDLGPFLSSQ